MQNKPFLSIVIPVYNGAKVINRCLNSIWGQELEESTYEVICVNDCSTDNTEQVIKQTQKSHANLRLLSNLKNKRAGGSRNYGVKEANGEYIVFIDADDYFHPTALKTAVEYIKKTNLDILMCDNSRGQENSIQQEMIHKYFNTNIQNGEKFFITNGFPLAPWKFIFRKELMLTQQLFFAENVQAEDADWVIKIGLSAKNIQYQPICLIHYVLTPSSLSANSYSARNFHDTIECGNRLYQLAMQYNSNKAISQRILNLSNFYYKEALKIMLQFDCKPSIKALNLKQICSNKPQLDNKIALIKQFATITSWFSNIVAPLISTAVKLKRKIIGR